MLVLADIGVLPSRAHDIDRALGQARRRALALCRPAPGGGQDDLIPVTLREGDRALGQRLTWEDAAAAAAFPEPAPSPACRSIRKSRVKRQVLAEPAADLPPKVWASLADGTPLVTAERRGKGLIVLFQSPPMPTGRISPYLACSSTCCGAILDLAPGAGGGAAGQRGRRPMRLRPSRRAACSTGNGRPRRSHRPTRGPIAGRGDRQAYAHRREHPAGLYQSRRQRARHQSRASGRALPPMGALPAGVRCAI